LLIVPPLDPEVDVVHEFVELLNVSSISAIIWFVTLELENRLKLSPAQMVEAEALAFTGGAVTTITRTVAVVEQPFSERTKS